jgi:outer membrane protein
MKNKSHLIGLVFSALCGWSSSIAAAEFVALDPVGITLEDFFTAALDYSPQLKIAEESLNIGSARRRAANGRLLPQLNASANVSGNRRNSSDLQGIQTFDGERYTLQLSQVLFNWQTFSQRSQAKLVEDQLEAEYYGELAFLFSDVAEKYFNVLQADDARESIDSELDAVNNQLNQIQSLYDRQLAQITDLYQAQASVAAVESEKLQLQSEFAMRQEALRSITGLSAGPLFRLSEAAQIPPLQNSINYWVQQARSGNYQIKAREFQLQVATERISESRGAYMPRVSLIVQRQDSNIGFENRPVAQNDNTYLGLDISIPLYAGGSNRAAVSEAHSQQLIAEYQLQQEQLDASERVRNAYLQVQSSELRTAAARKLLESTSLSATAAQRGFEFGTVTNVDVLNALRDQFRAERDLQRTRYQHVVYNLILKRETGILTAEDMLEVGSWLTAP